MIMPRVILHELTKKVQICAQCILFCNRAVFMLYRTASIAFIVSDFQLVISWPPQCGAQL